MNSSCCVSKVCAGCKNTSYKIAYTSKSVCNYRFCRIRDLPHGIFKNQKTLCSRPHAQQAACELTCKSPMSSLKFSPITTIIALMSIYIQSYVKYVFHTSFTGWCEMCVELATGAGAFRFTSHIVQYTKQFYQFLLVFLTNIGKSRRVIIIKHRHGLLGQTFALRC